jgi:flavin reductase (DIM6/NTAB) family NADH-FMN oxidoreductase RutF
MAARDYLAPNGLRTRGTVIVVALTDDGAATLTDGLASFDTTIYREVEAGDHTIVLLRLHAVDHADEALPLVFHRSGFGRLQHPA